MCRATTDARGTEGNTVDAWDGPCKLGNHGLRA
jgi:hypothetical protein